MNRKKAKKYKVINYGMQIFLALLCIVLVWMVFAESFSTNLCNEVSTCYTIVIFLVGIIVTLKFKLLDENRSRVELILFIIGFSINIIGPFGPNNGPKGLPLTNDIPRCLLTSCPLHHPQRRSGSGQKCPFSFAGPFSGSVLPPCRVFPNTFR